MNNAKKMNFVVQFQGGLMEAMKYIHSHYFRGGSTVLNRTEWRGYAPRTCGVTNVSGRQFNQGDPGPLIFDVEATYRPKGFVSYVGNTRYEGWSAMVPEERDGSIFYTPREVFHDTEFNDLDFGEFVNESEIESVPTTTEDAVIQEIMAGGRFSTLASGSFVAQHRHRPLTKIIFSNSPDGESRDGFGTRVININNDHPDPEQALMTKLHRLMCDFIEGKASVKNMGNDDLAYVELTDSVVDCTNNEHGLDSMFNMLNSYAPVGFLQDLALRLMSVYAIDVQIISGKGLVLRHEKKS